MAEEIGTEATSSENLQSGQSGQVSQDGGNGTQQQTQDQPTEQKPQSESFLGVTDVNAIPDELKPMYKDWETKYTQKRQVETEYIKQLEGRVQQGQVDNQLVSQKAEQLDILTANPEFQQWLVARSQQQGQQAPGYQPQMNFDEYEDGSGLKNLVSEMGNMIQHAVQPLHDEMTSIKSGFSMQRADTDFNLLVQQAKTNGWTDPGLLKKNIDFIRGKYPNMSLPDAYSIADSQHRRSGALNVKPVAGQQASSPGATGTKTGIPIVGDKGTVTNPPGGSAVQGNVGRTKSALDEVLGLQKAGKLTPGGRIDIESLVNKTIDDMRAQGQNIDGRDL